MAADLKLQAESMLENLQFMSIVAIKRAHECIAGASACKLWLLSCRIGWGARVGPPFERGGFSTQTPIPPGFSGSDSELRRH